MIQSSDRLHAGAMKVDKEFGSWLRELRRERRFTQRTLAARAGLSLGYISSVENGKRKPKTSSLVALAQALNVPYADLLRASGYLDDGLVLFAHRLHTTRVNLGLTLDELAAECGLSARTLERWESSPKQWPGDHMLERLATVLQVTADFLRGDSDSSTTLPVDLHRVLEQQDLTYHGVVLTPEQLKFVREFLQGVMNLSNPQTPEPPQRRPRKRK
ncbi:MAG: helix-turn-helix domain-containing protein [Bacilli bacterium]